MALSESRSCYFCGATGNAPFFSEPMERRWGRNVLPEDTYVALRCRRCGALYADSDVTSAYLTELYADETEQRIVEVTGGVTHEAIVSGRLPEFARNWHVMKRHRPPRPGDLLLDVGCQTGEFGAITQRDGVVPSGVELSREYAATAARLWGRDAEVNTRPLDLLSYDAGRFSYITAFETLEHMVDPIAALSLLRGWLADDGILALSVPSADYFVLKTRILDAKRHPPLLRSLSGRLPPRLLIPHTHIYTPSGRAVRLSLEKAGFDVVRLDVTGWHGRFSPLNACTSIVSTLTGERLLFAPSILAIARPARMR